MQVAEWLEATPIGVLVRDTQWGFHIVAGAHILGLALSVGIVLWFDLRLLGLAFRSLPVRTLYRRLIPWAGAGFTIMFVTGSMLLVAYATSAYDNPYVRIKLVALAMAGLNALLYHWFTEQRVAQVDQATTLPLPARMAGVLSIAAWMIVILAGRLMSYTMF